MLRLLSPALLATAVVAQTTTQAAVPANRFVPADSMLVVRVAAPAVWKTKFAGTEAAKAMRTPHAAQLIAAATQGMDAAMDALRQSGTVDAELVEKLLTSYSGDLTFSIQVDWDDVQTSMMEDRPPHFSMVFALSNDGSYDLGAFANAIDQLVEKEADKRRPLKDVTAGDVRLRITSDDESPMQASVPTLVDGQLVMLLGTDLEGAATRLLRSDKRYEGDLPKHPFFVHAKLDRFMATMVEAIESQLDASGMMPFEMGPILRKTGFTALDQIDLSIDSEDKVVVSSYRIGFGEGDLGFMAAMMGEGKPKLMRWLPAGCEQFGAQHFDFNVLYDTAIGIWKDLGDAVPLTAEDAEAAFAETLKVRLKEDLLAHMGDEMLSFQDFSGGGEEDEDAVANPFAAIGGSCFVIALRDGKAFGKNLETALRSRGMHAARKSEDYGDTKIYQLRLAGFIDVEYAVTDEMLLVTIGKGESGHRNLRGVLDARKRDGDAALPESVAKAVAALPEGWNGIGVMPVDGLLSAMMSGMGGVLATPGVPRDVKDVVLAVRGVGQDLRSAGIRPMISASYAKGRVLESRMRW